MTTQFKNQLLENISFLEMLAFQLTRDADKAEDLLQSTLEIILKRADYFRAGTNFRAWLTTVMRNNFINGYRKHKRRMYWSQLSVRKVLSSSEEAVYNDGIQNLNLAYIKGSVADLDEKYRRPFLMMTEGFQYDEIAKVMGIPIGTVKSRIHQARKKLRPKLMEMRA